MKGENKNYSAHILVISPGQGNFSLHLFYLQGYAEAGKQERSDKIKT